MKKGMTVTGTAEVLPRSSCGLFTLTGKLSAHLLICLYHIEGELNMEYTLNAV